MMSSKAEQTIAVRALRNAAPYIRMYKGKVFVIKAGGGVFGDEEATRQLIEQVAILHQVGIRVVLVHGGGPQLTELADALGVPTRIVQGRRVTDQRSLEVTSMVLNGLINTRILAICRELNIDAVGGKLLDNGLMPVVSPLSADQYGTLLNINADTVAAAIGSALNAEKLVLCTGAPGILERLEDPSSLISYTDLQGLKRLRDAGSLADVFTNEGTGTLIVADLNALSDAEQQGSR